MAQGMKHLVRVLVTGGRSYPHTHIVFKALTQVLEEDCGGTLARLCVVQGGCQEDEERGWSGGADRWAREWAAGAGVCSVSFHAQWRALGGPAGPARTRCLYMSWEIPLVWGFRGGAGTCSWGGVAGWGGVQVRLFG